MFSASESDFMLLYGFCTATAQEPFAWKRREIVKTHQKTHQSIWSAILSEAETTTFIKFLTQPGLVSLGDELSFWSPELVERPIVLSNDGKTKETPWKTLKKIEDNLECFSEKRWYFN